MLTPNIQVRLFADSVTPVLCNFSNASVSSGNNFDEPWEDFCATDAGNCGPIIEPQAPVITINSPSNSATLQFGNSVNISVNATDNDGTIASVTIEVDDAPQIVTNPSGDNYITTWTPLSCRYLHNYNYGY